MLDTLAGLYHELTYQYCWFLGGVRLLGVAPIREGHLLKSRRSLDHLRYTVQKEHIGREDFQPY